jgi:selenide, water dikinase
MQNIKLTETVKKGGCAAKVPAMILREILGGVKFPPNIEGVEIDGSNFDDAAIFKIDDSVALVQTLDFFTPIVDSPRNFGAIAAANALSDVYAMGGKPKTCMAILAAPLAVLEPSVIQEVLQGACDVIALSGSSLVGGHSIDDDTLKFGLSVTGLIHPQKVWINSQAKIGDKLILTKPLGTGTICAGIKRQELTEEEAHEAIESMKRLNNIQDLLTTEQLEHIHAATDITGFGLAGHGFQMAKASGVSLKVMHRNVPKFLKARECLEKGFLTKAHRSNEEYTRGKIMISDQLSESEKLIAFDPQTSGGLLLSVGLEAAEKIVEALAVAFPGTAIIGEVQEKSDFDVYLE